MSGQAFDVTRFHAALTTRALGREFIFEPSVGSTMDVARGAAAHGAPEGTVCAADEQTAGRGRLGRSWVNPPAVNLASTLILRPPTAILRQIAMMTPLAIAQAVEEVCGLRPDLKWPNDVQIGGKKLAGILIETDFADPEHPVVYVGAGINVNFDPREHEEIRGIATSLRAELEREVDREALLAAYLGRFEGLYDDAKAGRSPHAAWKSRLVTLGQRVHVSSQGGEIDGVAEDVDADGSLLVRQGDGTLAEIEAADVTLRDQESAPD